MDPSLLKMDSSRRMHRINSNQLGLLVDFMTLNPELIIGKITSKFSQHARQKKWEELTALLNSDELGVKKEPSKWRKTWTDWKHTVKKKVTALRKYELGFGDEPPECQRLTYLEERCLKLLQSASSEGLEEDTDGSDTECAEVSDINPIEVRIPEVPANSFQILNIQENNVEVPTVETSNVQILNAPTSVEGPTIERINEENFNPKRSASNPEPPSKRLKILHHPRQSKLMQLLIRQNELLENISSAMERIEKFLEARDSPQNVKRKNDLLENISINMEKIAGSLDVTSQSLKRMSEK